MSKVQTLTTKQLQDVFGVAHMTIYNWRQGTATKEALAAETAAGDGPKPRVSFKVTTVKAWAKKHGVEMARSPEEVLAEAEAPPKKARKKIAH